MKRVQGTAEHIPAEPEHAQEKKIPKVVTQPKEVFDHQYLEPLRGLIFLGNLQHEYELGGHSFLLKTMSEGDILRVGQLTKDYRGSLSEYESQRVYTVAASIVNVDGKPLLEPLSDDDKKYDMLYEKAQVVKKWYPAVVHFLHDRYLELEQSAIDATMALKK